LFAYDRVIHDHCPRRAHFDAGRFAGVFGDEAHKKGYCLFKLGCKGPVTHAACSTRHFNEIPDCWPIGLGAPCFGCTEKEYGFTYPAYQTVDVHLATPPDAYAPVGSTAGKIGVAAAGLVGVVAGALGGSAWAAGQKLQSSEEIAAAETKSESAKSGGR